MKTNKFEHTIRQKLESISPDFQEEDWAKMQNYMQVHTPPTIWKQYGSWIGYAAAASVTTVMAFLYVGQLSKNDNLASDVKKLQNQIETIHTAAATLPRTDTVYIVQKEITKDQFLQESQNYSANGGTELTAEATDGIAAGKHNAVPVPRDFARNEDFSSTSSEPAINKKAGITKREVPGESVLPEKMEYNKFTAVANRSIAETSKEEITVDPSVNTIKGNNQTDHFSNAPVAAEGTVSVPPVQQSFAKTLDNNQNVLTEIKAVPLKNNSRQMNYALANRLLARQVNKVWLAANAAASKAPVEEKKAEKITKAENVIPKLNLKVPYRFGAGIQLERRSIAKTVVGEVLVAKKFSVSAGISWLKVKPMEFITEKIFREKNRQDFKKAHPNEVPMAFEIRNIHVKPTLVQIPLTVAFRNDLNHDFSYFVSAGTNVTVKGRETFSFDCKVPYPKPQYISQGFERKMDIPVLNSLNVSAGIEKTWHPIVIQLEGYLYSYFKPLSPDNPLTGPGVRLKLLYQIGRKM